MIKIDGRECDTIAANRSLIRGVEKVVILSEHRIDVEDGTIYDIEIEDGHRTMVLESSIELGSHHKYIFANHEEEVIEDEQEVD